MGKFTSPIALTNGRTYEPLKVTRMVFKKGFLKPEGLFKSLRLILET